MNEPAVPEIGRKDLVLYGKIDLLIGLGLFLMALVSYLATVGAGAYPGASAALIVESLNIFPKMLPSHPLWHALAWIFARIPVGGVAFRLNLLSALCGAGVIWLLYSVSRLTVEKSIDPFSRNRDYAPFASRLAGIVSALFLAFSVPFWMVSNRAHTAAFDLLFTLAVVRLFLYWMDKGRAWIPYLIVFLSAALSCEFATAILLLPVIGILVLVLLWRKSELRAVTVAGLALSTLAGLSLYFLTAWIFFGSEGYVLRGYSSYFHIVTQMLRLQYGLLMHSLPRDGWLIILFVAVVPWFTALIVGRRALNVERDWSYYLLHVIMTSLAVIVLVNVRIAPWPMLREQAEITRGRLLVTPYLLSASLFGYLVAYWFLLPMSWWERAESRLAIRARKWLGAILVVPAVVTLLVMPFKNAGPANGKQARFVNEYAAAIIDALKGHEWLVSDGSVDNHLKIIAWDRNVDLNILSLPASRNELYMRYVATMFDNLRLKNLTQVSMMALLHEWNASDPDFADKVAVQAVPDIWVGEGYRPVPNKLVFFGAGESDAPEVSGSIAEHKRFWDEILPVINNAGISSTALAGIRAHMIRHIAFVANNLGVWLEDNGGGEEIFEIYEKARDIDPQNVSALLNQLAMINNGVHPERAEAVQNDIRSLLGNIETKYRIWSLSRYYGYVRLPQAFADLGWKWAYSGQPSLAVAGIRRAMELLPEEDRGRIRNDLASIYLSQRDAASSEELYSRILKEKPADIEALIGMGRVELLKGRFKEALSFLRKAREAGAEHSRIALELAGVLAASGNDARARVILEELIDLEPDREQAWALLLALVVQDHDEKALSDCIHKMREAKIGRGFVLSMAEGHLALLRNEVSKARSYFERILAVNPNHAHVLDVLLRLDLQQGRMDTAEEHLKRLLKINPDHAFANTVKGSLQYSRGNLLLAEDSFRKALESARTPEVLNDLAWVLQERNQYVEAEQLVREALAANEEMSGGWDTLGVILMRTGRLVEACDAMERALSLSGGNPVIYLHLAELYKKSGANKDLRRMIDLLSEDDSVLNKKQLKRLKELRE